MNDATHGRAAWIFEDNFDVDLIVGVENISVTDLSKILDATMKAQDPDFKEKVHSGDVLIGGRNFGYGHPHPQPMLAMRKLGIDVIIAESFAFPFYRSELASGMKLIICPGVRQITHRWDQLTVDTANGLLRNETQGIQLTLEPIPETAREIMDAGGVVGYLKSRR